MTIRIVVLFVIFLAAHNPLAAQVDFRSDSIHLVVSGRIYEALRGRQPSPVLCGPMPLTLGPDKMAKFANGTVWLGDGHRILYKECRGGAAIKAKLPEKLSSFSAFDVIEDGRLVLWAPVMVNDKGEPLAIGPGSEWTLGMLVNPEKGEVDLEFSKWRVSAGMDFYDGIAASEAITAMVGDYLVIAGKYSGRLTLLEPKTGKTRDIEAIGDSNLPPKGKERVNHGPSVTQLVPLPWGELLIGIRHWLPEKAETPGRWLDLFRILNLSDFSLTEVELTYEGVRAGSGMIWVDWDHKAHLLERLESDLEAAKLAGGYPLAK